MPARPIRVLLIEDNPRDRLFVEEILARSTTPFTLEVRSRLAEGVARLGEGEVDIITQLPPDHGERISQNASTRVAGAIYAGLYVLAVNSKVKPLDNPLTPADLNATVQHMVGLTSEQITGLGLTPVGRVIDELF